MGEPLARDEVAALGGCRKRDEHTADLVLSGSSVVLGVASIWSVQVSVVSGGLLTIAGMGVLRLQPASSGRLTVPPKSRGRMGRAPDRSEDQGAGGALVRFASASSTAS